MPLQGHCMCEAVQVTVQDTPSGEPHQTIYCHCTTCRRQSGASGTYVAIVDDKLVEIKDPKGVQKTWKDMGTDSGTPATRTFCGECGSPIATNTPLLSGKIIIKMGLFDEIPPAVLEMYTKNKQSWEPAIEGVKTVEGAPS